MPLQGLSLFGFLDQTAAVAHLKSHCIPESLDENHLIASWEKARDRVSMAVDRAGYPERLPIPSQYEDHIGDLITRPWIAPYFADLPSFTFEMVELNPLLAFQITVNSQRSDFHCASLTNPPTMKQLLDLCLPLEPQTEQFQIAATTHSMILKTPSLNLRMIANGQFNPNILGFQFGVSLPFMHVVRHNGRMFLHNGFHRALGLHQSGATHAPCIVRDVPDYASVGIGQGTFSPQLLESSNPPTVGHFNLGKAHPVTLRSLTRVLHVSWAEYVLSDDY